VIFIAFSNPISSHALARANYKRKNYPLLKGGAEYDQYRQVYDEKEENNEEQHKEEEKA